MKILVTGGAGFIASHVVDKYIELGHEVVIVDNLSTGRQENINPAAKFYEIDICSPEIEKIFDVEKPDIVNHHAAQISVPKSVIDPLLDAKINAMGFLNVLQCCVKHNTSRVINVSSGGAIYGEATEYPTTESYSPKPLSPYAIHKYLSEIYLHYYHEAYGIKYVTLRYANVYGPRQIPTGEAGVVSIFIETLLNNKTPYLFAYPEDPDGMIRDYVYVQDVVKANIVALDCIPNDAYNIGTGIETTTGMLLGEICHQLNKEYNPIKAPPRPGDIRQSCLDNTKANKIMGWVPEFTLTDGLKKTIVM
jgi:UDP-glucose 4-epimerase